MLIKKLLIIWYPFVYPHGTVRAKRPFKGVVGAGTLQESNPRPLETRAATFSISPRRTPIILTCGIYATKQSELNLHKLMNHRFQNSQNSRQLLSRDSCTRIFVGGVNTKHNGRVEEGAAVNNK